MPEEEMISQSAELPLTRRAMLGGLAAVAVTPWLSPAASGQTASPRVPRRPAGTLLPRQQHTSTPLGGGYILVAGGMSGGILSDVQIIYPNGGVTSAASLNTPRYGHAAVLLPYGRVLVLGGYYQGALDDAEVYDPIKNTWFPVKPLSLPRYNHTAVLVSNTQVMVIGGYFEGPLADTELYTL